MLLAIDVGNTNTVLGLCPRELSEPISELWRARTDADRTADEWLITINQMVELAGHRLADVDGIVIGSVVPRVGLALVRMCKRLRLEPLVIKWDTPGSIPIDLDDPREVGPDRIANATAAFDRRGGPCIVVDMGTATTLDVVSAQGSYIGGVILPGVEVSLNALFDHAAALRKVELVPPVCVVGHNTANAVQSGATFGYAAQIDGLCRKIKQEIGDAPVIATGGLSAVIAPLSDEIEKYEPTLTLHGLRILYSRNDNSRNGNSQIKDSRNEND